jgi:uncharacterized membrane protein YwzB
MWNLQISPFGQNAQALCFGSFVGVKYFWTLQKLSLNSMVRNSANASLSAMIIVSAIASGSGLEQVFLHPLTWGDENSFITLGK